MALGEDMAENAAEPWIAARDWAVLLLLYGAGLRISEAMALTADILPLGETIRVLGKRGKTRIVPLLPELRSAIEDYARQSPYPLIPGEPLFRGPRAGRYRPRSSADRCRVRVSDWAWAGGRRPMRCATALPRIFWGAVRICGSFRNCSAMPVSARRKSIPRSTPRTCSTSTAPPIREPSVPRVASR
ncbi:hypothetical protein GCM10020258_25530 [Sphingomonas yabuuchiae]